MRWAALPRCFIDSCGKLIYKIWQRSRRPTDVQTGVSIRVKTSNFFQKNQGLKQISEMANRAQKVQKVMVQPIVRF